MPIVLSAQQEQIVGWFGGTSAVDAKVRNLVIRARAGTGKTYTSLLGIDAAKDARIAFCAFNKRIAEEIKAKLRNPRAEAKTLHALGFGFVTRNRRGAKPDSKRGTEDAMRAAPGAPTGAIRCIEKLASLAKGILPLNTKVADVIDLALDYDVSPDAESEEKGWDVPKCAAAAVQAMMYAKEPNAANTITFDDMVWLPVVMGWARPTYDMVVVDECQDMNMSQILLAQRCCKPTGRIVVVGDDRQAIYGFRGADSGSLDRLKCELNAAEMPLTITRRCPKAVVALARTLVPDYEAAPDAPEGTVCDKSAAEMYKDADVGDFILSRKNAPLAHIALHFLRAGKRARIEGKDIGAGLVSVVRKVAGKSKCGIADMLAKLARYEEKQVAKLHAANGKTMEARIAFVEDQCETIRAIADGCDSTAALITKIESLFSDSDPAYGAKPPPAIVCSTVHKAKGLEARKVWVCTDTLYPGGRKTQEEDNIAYVAYTRAIDTLCLVKGIK